MTLLSAIYGSGSEEPYFNEPVSFDSFGYIAGNYYPFSKTLPSSSAQNVATGLLFYTPFIPRVTHTFTGIGVYSSNASNDTKKMRLGIYNDDGAGNPSGAALLDAGEITFTATPGLFILTISQQLVGGTIYHLAATGDTTSINLISVATGLSSIPTLSNIGVSSVRTGGLFHTVAETFVYAALPTVGTLEISAGNNPIIYMKG